jgi:hypothetical protein
VQEAAAFAQMFGGLPPGAEPHLTEDNAGGGRPEGADPQVRPETANTV